MNKYIEAMNQRNAGIRMIKGEVEEIEPMARVTVVEWEPMPMPDFWHDDDETEDGPDGPEEYNAASGGGWIEEREQDILADIRSYRNQSLTVDLVETLED